MTRFVAGCLATPLRIPVRTHSCTYGVGHLATLPEKSLYLNVHVTRNSPFPLCSSQCIPRPTPTAGQPGGYHGVYLGVCCLFKPLGCGGFHKFCPHIGITGFVYIEIHSDYSSACYKIKVLILQNIEAVMFKFSGGVDVRQSYMFKVMGGGAGASAMF